MATPFCPLSFCLKSGGLPSGRGATGQRPESGFSPRRSQRNPVGLEAATFGAEAWRSTRSTIGSVVSGQKGEGATKLARPPFFQKKNKLSHQRKKKGSRRGVAAKLERMGMGMGMGTGAG